MSYPVIVRCPVCNGHLEVISLKCDQCNTKVEGHFYLDKFSYLSKEQKKFIEIFLKCRGNIKEVEKELDVSYPTVRGKLDDVIQSLGYTIDNEKRKKNRKEILEKLKNGEITYDEAMNLLKT